MNVPDQVDERKDKIPMQTSEQSWLSISQQKNEEKNFLYFLLVFRASNRPIFHLV